MSTSVDATPLRAGRGSNPGEAGWTRRARSDRRARGAHRDAVGKLVRKDHVKTDGTG
jgi:hypothetical protein